MTGKNKLDTESYKGVRDFYPEDMFIQNYIFSTWKSVVEKFGYNQYDASILEPAELYRAKSGEEIVNEQTYTFTDRGDREVTLRPEMTPTVTRMVAGRIHDLPLPIRWYSMPNLFRYEKPQRGRLREHWQLNVDVFGIAGNSAETELITIAYEIMKKFGAEDHDFVIKVNSRKLVTDIFAQYNLSDTQIHAVSKLIDKKHKLSAEAFATSLVEVMDTDAHALIALLNSGDDILQTMRDNVHVMEIVSLIDTLKQIGIHNAVFDPTLMRGFDYYTGIVFEVFDCHPDNNRSVFGGGRYDDLLDIFGVRKLPTVGFGAGDVTVRDFLEVHGFLPTYKPSAEIYICTLGSSHDIPTQNLAQSLRQAGIAVATDSTDRKVGDKIKSADKQKIPYVICVGDNEIQSGTYTLKNLAVGSEQQMTAEEIIKFFRV